MPKVGFDKWIYLAGATMPADDHQVPVKILAVFPVRFHFQGTILLTWLITLLHDLSLIEVLLTMLRNNYGVEC